MHLNRKLQTLITAILLILIFPGLLKSAPGLSVESENNDLQSTQQIHIKRRRDMLDKHQIWGLAAWAFWLATNLEGEAVARTQERAGQQSMDLLLLSSPEKYSTLYILHQENASYESSRNSATHTSLAALTWFTYSVAAYYAYMSPDPWKEAKREGFDSIFLHKTLAFFHLAAMLALPFLGKAAEEYGPEGVQKMRNVGWAGFGVYTVAIGTFYF